MLSTQGMIYLHNSNLKSHGKLKSSNVLIDGRWVCKLADFGLHKFKVDKNNQQSKTETEIYRGELKIPNNMMNNIIYYFEVFM